MTANSCQDGRWPSALRIDVGPTSVRAPSACGKNLYTVDRIKEDIGCGLEVKVAFGDSSSLYVDCQLVRSEAGDVDLRHLFDAWSYHFVMYHLGRPVGAMTATRCSDGPVDQEAFYPQAFMNAHRAIAFSSCKLRINQFDLRGLGTFRRFTEAAWTYLAGLGLRVDIMNCEVDKRSAYESVGYRCLNGFDFIHSDLATVSRVMLLSADPSHPSMFRKLFQSLSNPVSLTDTLASLHLTFRAPESPTEGNLQCAERKNHDDTNK